MDWNFNFTTTIQVLPYIAVAVVLMALLYTEFSSPEQNVEDGFANGPVLQKRFSAWHKNGYEYRVKSGICVYIQPAGRNRFRAFVIQGCEPVYADIREDSRGRYFFVHATDAYAAEKKIDELYDRNGNVIWEDVEL